MGHKMDLVHSLKKAKFRTWKTLKGHGKGP